MIQFLGLWGQTVLWHKLTPTLVSEAENRFCGCDQLHGHTQRPVYHFDHVPLQCICSYTDYGVIIGDDLRFHKQNRTAARKASGIVHSFLNAMFCRDLGFMVLQSTLSDPHSLCTGAHISSVEYWVWRGYLMTQSCAKAVDSLCNRPRRQEVLGKAQVRMLN